ncbi:MAG TPA: 1-deoxy-D-xylulose-5-phosphate synthase N-terminal domain-containing protein [Methylomirabilota bacterium]|nr:1-deoxy-D-xylulose-5-phosphate synthase N-terminal domain-containing protein [Methylomirabilota bacterium]
MSPDTLACLHALRQKVLWLSTWMIHHANHVRPNRDGLKVGGHQASSASALDIMIALYFAVLRPEDRVAVKPHASPVFHAIQYLLGRQTRERLERFRALGGAQAYPSRTKDADDVDFSTGSVGLGVALTLCAALVQDYVRLHGLMPEGVRPGRMIALAGDAEFDEGNVFEAMLEGWKHDVRNVWWVVDYNRQSLDSVVSERLFGRIEDIFRTTGFEVVQLKYGARLQAVFRRPGGEALRRWIDECPNQVYSALTFKGGAAWRAELERDLKSEPRARALVDAFDDRALHELMTNLAGHDLESLLTAFHAVPDDRPRCFLAYTIKGYRLPLAGHRDNHAGMLTPGQMKEFQHAMGIPEGREWDPFVGLDVSEAALRTFLAAVPFARAEPRSRAAEPVMVPERLDVLRDRIVSTQAGFGRVLSELGSGDTELAQRIVTISPDVTLSTNLGGWVNRRGIFHRSERRDAFRDLNVPSPQRWAMSPSGQHFELGIAEHNLFIMLAALGLAAPLFGVRLLPVGTLYDPFVLRGLDAFGYACYQDARFMVVGTPAGISLAPEGGAHQSIATPLVGMAMDRCTAFEPAYIDELVEIMLWGFRHLQADDGGSVYLRLTTRPLPQPEREMTPALREGILAGAYWIREPTPGADVALVYCGPVVAEAAAAHEAILDDIPEAGLLAVTSPDRLYADWSAGPGSHIDRLLTPLAQDAALVTVLDGHPAALSWLGSVRGHRTFPLGVDHFGQSADVVDLYRVHGIDEDAILDAVARACVERRRW